MEKLSFYKFENQHDYADFVSYLKLHSKEESIQDKIRHQKIVKTQKPMICLTMAQIRECAKDIMKSNYSGFLKLSNDEIYEVCMIRGIVMAGLKDNELSLKLLDDWVKHIDCWSLCDSVVSSIKWLKTSESKTNYFYQFLNMCYSDEEFIARFGLVVLMTYYLEEEFIDKIYLMIKELKAEQFYVQMAAAWLLSSAYVRFPQKTFEFLNQKSIQKFIQNKAISKCCDSFRISKNEKTKLKKLRI